MTATAQTRPRERGRAPVHDVTVVLVTHAGGPVVGQVLDALAGQTRPPDRLVLTGLPSDGEEVAQARMHPLIARHGVELLVREPLTSSLQEEEPALCRVVADATAHLVPRTRSWLWLLHDDSLPEPAALEQLIEATRRSSRVGVVGPKLVSPRDPGRLVAVGSGLTRSGRPVGAGLPGQLDQGQYDERVDVLAVPVPGMLVRTDVLAAVGGLDPAFDGGVEGIDLCWRCHLRGDRVVVAPGAVVRQGSAGLGMTSPLRTRRRLRQAALAREAWWLWPWRALGILVGSVLAALALLLLKRPREAVGELSDAAAVLSPWRGLGARWRFHGRVRVRRRDLSGLFAPASASMGGVTELLPGALVPRAERDTQSLGGGPGPRRSSWPLAGALALATLAAMAWWRELWPALSGAGYGVQGGELYAVRADAAAVWHTWWGGRRSAGLDGAIGTGEPWLLPAAAASWLLQQLPGVDASASPAAVTTTWLLFAAVPLSVLSAYLAGRTVLPHRLVRALGALIWAGLPPLSQAVAEGRVGPVVGHVLMPLVVAGFAVSVGRGDGARRTAATFGTVLALGLVGAFAPPVLVVSTVAALLVLLLGRGWARARGLVLAVLPWVLLAPWVRDARADPRLVLGGPGVTSTQGRVEPWQTLLLHPGGPQSAALWWTLPLLVLAVAAVLRTGRRGRRAGVLLTGALLGLAAALAAPLAPLGTVPAGHDDAGAVVTTWPGVYLSVAAACLLLAAGAAVDRVGWGARGSGVPWRRALAGVGGGVTLVAGLAVLASAAWAGTGPGLTGASAPDPAVLAEPAEGPAGAGVRMVALLPAGGAVTDRLGDVAPDPWVRDRVRELSPVTAEAGAATAPASAVAGGAGRRLDHPPADRTWHLVAAGAALLAVVLALPPGPGRSRAG